MTTFHKTEESKPKSKKLWQKVKAIEEKKKGGSGPSGASGSASGASGPSGSGASGAESTPSQDAIARLASMENVIYGQVNAARKKELRDQKEKAKLTNMVNKLSAELAEARKPKDPVSLIKKSTYVN